MPVHLPLEVLIKIVRNLLEVAPRNSTGFVDQAEEGKRSVAAWTQALQLRLVCKAFDDVCMLYLFGSDGEDSRDWKIYEIMSTKLVERSLGEKLRTNSLQPIAVMIRESVESLSALGNEEYGFFARQACKAASEWIHTREVHDLLSMNTRREIFTSASANTNALAAFTGQTEFLSKLDPSDLDKGCCYIGTPLIAAATSGDLATVKYLVEAGASMNLEYEKHKHRGTVLVAASRYGHSEIVKYLIEKDVSVDITEDQFDLDCLPLTAAAFNDHMNVLELLFPCYAKNTERIRIYGHALVSAISRKREDIAIRLLECGIDPLFSLNASQTNIFAWAAKLGCDKVILRLLEMGVPVNYYQEPKSTNLPALTLAAIEGRFSTVKLLLQNGADVNLQHKRRATALHAAVVSGNVDIVDLLLRSGADPNRTTDWNPWTYKQFSGHPLDGAFQFRLANIARLLVERGGVLEYKEDERSLADLLLNYTVT